MKTYPKALGEILNILRSILLGDRPDLGGRADVDARFVGEVNPVITTSSSRVGVSRLRSATISTSESRLSSDRDRLMPSNPERVALALRL